MPSVAWIQCALNVFKNGILIYVRTTLCLKITINTILILDSCKQKNCAPVLPSTLWFFVSGCIEASKTRPQCLCAWENVDWPDRFGWNFHTLLSLCEFCSVLRHCKITNTHVYLSQIFIKISQMISRLIGNNWYLTSISFRVMWRFVAICRFLKLLPDFDLLLRTSVNLKAKTRAWDKASRS